MSTYTASSFQCVEAEEFNYQDTGTQQSWQVATSEVGYSAGGYLVVSGVSSTNGQQPQSAIAYIQNYTPAGVQSKVWFRMCGTGSIIVDYANFNNFETISVNGGWTWVLANNPIIFSSQIRLFSVDRDVKIDKVIITQAVEAPSGSAGFTNTNTNPGGGTGGADDGNVSTEACYATETIHCFALYEAESAFWLEQGANSANFSILNDALDASSGEYLSMGQSPSTFSDAPKAHIPIIPTLTNNWSLWVRVRGNGGVYHVNADDNAQAALMTFNSTSWIWVKSLITVTPYASKVKIAGIGGAEVDKIALIDSTDQPTDIDGFCIDNSGAGGDDSDNDEPSPDTEPDDQTDQNYLWLPENLECRVNVIPHEVTNK